MNDNYQSEISNLTKVPEWTKKKIFLIILFKNSTNPNIVRREIDVPAFREDELPGVDVKSLWQDPEVEDQILKSGYPVGHVEREGIRALFLQKLRYLVVK